MEFLKKLACAGILAGSLVASLEAAIVSITSDIETDTNWTSANEYILEGIIYVKNDALLTIEAGTVIRGQPNDVSNPTVYNPGALVITRSGQINAQGTPSNPIVFTSAVPDDGGSPAGLSISGTDYKATPWTSGAFWDSAPKTAPKAPSNIGLWGGVIILGRAPTNTDWDAGTAGVQLRNIEGLPVGEDSQYGGQIPSDNSGVFSYVSIRHGGAVIGSDNEINGLSLGGVGYGTQVDHVEIWGNVDDGIEFFGGTVNTSYMVVVAPNDDGFDIDEGHTGSHQFWLAIAGDNTDNLGEWDGFETTTVLKPTGEPYMQVIVSNATFIGYPGATRATSQGLRIRDDAGPRVINSIFTDIKGKVLRITDGDTLGDASADTGTTDSVTKFATGEAFLRSSTFYGINGETETITDTTSNDLTNFVQSTTYNNILRSSADPAASAYSYKNILRNPGFKAFTISATGPTYINPVALQSGQGGSGQAVSTGLEPVTGPFFTSASYRGAFPTSKTSALWTTGWTAANISGALVSAGNE